MQEIIIIVLFLCQIYSMGSPSLFKKVKTEHTILKDFCPFLLYLEKLDAIQRLIPGRISRQQKGSSNVYIHFSYFISSGLKCKMSKGSTSQELFIVCHHPDKEGVLGYCQQWADWK